MRHFKTPHRIYWNMSKYKIHTEKKKNRQTHSTIFKRFENDRVFLKKKKKSAFAAI